MIFLCSTFFILFKIYGSYLAPSLPVPNLALVFQMGDHLRLTGQSPDQTAAVGGWILLGRSHVHPRLVHVRRSFVQRADQQFHESVNLWLIFVVIGQLECVVEEYMSWNKIVFTRKKERRVITRGLPLTFIQTDFQDQWLTYFRIRSNRDRQLLSIFGRHAARTGLRPVGGYSSETPSSLLCSHAT